MKLAEAKVEFDVDAQGEVVDEKKVVVFPQQVIDILEAQVSCRIRLTVIVERMEAE